MISNVKQYKIQQSTYFEGERGDDNNDHGDVAISH
jgi:hypothetical protein